MCLEVIAVLDFYVCYTLLFLEVVDSPLIRFYFTYPPSILLVYRFFLIVYCYVVGMKVVYFMFSLYHVNVYCNGRY